MEPSDPAKDRAYYELGPTRTVMNTTVKSHQPKRRVVNDQERIIHMRVEYDVSHVDPGYRHWEWDDPVSEPRPLPLETWLSGCESALQGSRERKRALMAERGLTAATARGVSLGWDAKREVWILPVRDEDGQLVNVRYRPPKGSGRKPESIGGRTVANGGLPLWPRVPFDDDWVLCAGEWDALAVLQAGLNGVTGLCGCTWQEEWNRDARGRRIAVLYDVGEEERADITVERLRCIGAKAWPVRLPNIRDGFDPCDVLIEFGESELVRLIEEARP